MIRHLVLEHMMDILSYKIYIGHVLYLLAILPFDKLLVYSILTMTVSCTSLWIYRIYCLKKFPECSLTIKIDKSLCKEMLIFSSWSAFGQLIIAINNS